MADTRKTTKTTKTAHRATVGALMTDGTGQQYRDTGAYPYAVLREGARGKRLYDECIRELTTGENPVSIDVADFVVTEQWPTLISMLAPEGEPGVDTPLPPVNLRTE